MKLCIYGGQYGSEGKGSAAEWFIANSRRPNRRLIAFGENSPNSGHTCSLGKTRNLPASAYWADIVVMGPDSAINLTVLEEDIGAIKQARNGEAPDVFIHEHAAIVTADHASLERLVVESISSTGSGSGAARALDKQFNRAASAVIGRHAHHDMFKGGKIKIVDRFQYQELIRAYYGDDCVFECSQGTLLDVNFGVYPFVTSRSTLPRVAVERNALGGLGWQYVGVYRTFPIRTGGPSGPTGGREVTFSSLQLAPEIATVTGRTRRIFEFDIRDFRLSLDLTRPNFVCFTHTDYIACSRENLAGFEAWLKARCNGKNWICPVDGLFLSDEIGKFVNHGAYTI